MKEVTILPNFRENVLSYTLPVQNIFDLIYNEKPKSKTNEMRTHILENKNTIYQIGTEYFESGN
jgi:hypothetical protein